MNQTTNSFEVNHMDIYRKSIYNNRIYKVQPSQKIAPQGFPFSPNCDGNLQILKKFGFPVFDLIDSECFPL